MSSPPCIAAHDNGSGTGFQTPQADELASGGKELHPCNSLAQHGLEGIAK